jgi:hypothetical protein
LAQCAGCAVMHLPLFIPAYQSVQAMIELKYTFPDGHLPEGKPERLQAYDKAMADLKEHYARLEGFVGFDRERRVEIDLAPGWKK